MDDKAKLAVSALGIMMLIGAIQCAHSTINLNLFAWNAAFEFGLREVFGYLVLTGVMSALSVVAVVLLSVMGVMMAIGPWRENQEIS
jgi:hypothetical protein